jgi:hypothetical protein
MDASGNPAWVSGAVPAAAPLEKNRGLYKIEADQGMNWKEYI